MSNFTDYLASGHAWLYVPVAILLGALHGLEPGHSKTMMAAFIIAIRGTIWQAVLLGLSAAISHSLLIWVLAALALHYGGQWNAEHTEPYFHLASAAMIFGLAVWMYLRTRREVAEAHAHDHRDGHEHGHSHEHDTPPAKSDEPDQWQAHSHSHDTATVAPRLLVGETMTQSGLILPAGMAAPSAAPSRSTKQGAHGGMLLDTGHGWLEVCIFETGVPPRFRIYPCKASGEAVPLPKGTQLGIETARLDGRTQKFAFEPRDTFWEATSELPEPHEFLAVISLGHSDHAHTYRLRFTEEHHGHSHAPVAVEEPEDDGVKYQDAHERAHAQDIAKRFANRTVTTPQIVLFGITGGLMPCPAAFTILVVCLQIKKVVLGFALVAAFSFGLALTMVTVGALAAWSINHAEKRFSGFGDWMRRAPYISCALLVLLAAFMAWQGWQGLSQPHPH
ncbi:sulfite exporter TauE/SafE family protein [Prosthecobacter sp.]|uniref:HoxN/HupN/NixA family nickel/cobalt transporter n=1 Tax=Prosthecobacter sp. TaxID=1965333 RepID=UPI002AB8A75E|nr:sulfite exporter TauE/SafE family protein [Prosthecobacter sp.]MDZ4405465.1 sulfite exporter TauE/SafE family protein [Prosthecobacter sp.]